QLFGDGAVTGHSAIGTTSAHQSHQLGSSSSSTSSSSSSSTNSSSADLLAKAQASAAFGVMGHAGNNRAHNLNAAANSTDSASSICSSLDLCGSRRPTQLPLAPKLLT